MQVVDLNDLNQAHRDVYFACLECCPEGSQEGREHKARWYTQMRDRGLGVKLAIDNDGALAGMIQYLPIELTFAEGRDLYVILCIWVHGHRRGVGNHQHHGLGGALLRAAETDVATRGAKGMVAWGLALPTWMRASWFKKHGYTKVERDGLAVMLWKPFCDQARPPRWRQRKALPPNAPNKATVTAFVNGWCPAMNMVSERARRACAACGDEVAFRMISTLDDDIRDTWGITDGLFIDDKQIRTGPPLSYNKLLRMIRRRVRHHARHSAPSSR